MADFRDEVFEGKIGNKQINNLLGELRNEGKIFFDGPRRSPKSYWRMNESNEVDME